MALAEGLAAIHDCGLIHRDLKPGNVILADDGPRIIDFGIAKGADATALTGSNAVIGTLRYMSPEQLNGHELTPHSDVFALGTVLAYAATGHDPFEAPTIPAVITRILVGPPDLDPLTGELRAIIGECLAKDPGSRPSTGNLLVRFHDRGTNDPTVVAAPVPVRVPGPVPAAVPSPQPQAAEEGGRAHAAQEPSYLDTADASPVISAGRINPPTAHGDPRAAQPIAAPRPARKPPPGRSQHRTGLVAPGTVAVVAVAAQLMVVLNATIVNIALPSAQRDLAFSNADRQWVVTVYSLAFGGLLLLGWRLSDLVGRRQMMIIGVVGFAGASVLGGAATSFRHARDRPGRSGGVRRDAGPGRAVHTDHHIH